MRYAAIFSIVTKHNYYTDGVCPDVQIDSTAGTSRILRGHRWITRPGPGMVAVAAEVDQGGKPLIGLDPSVSLQFRIAVATGQFHLFTELGAVTPSTVYVPGADETGPVRALRPTMAPAPAAGSETLAGVEIPAALLRTPVERPLEFQLRFEARRTRWKYYFVTDMKLNGQRLQIVDGGSSADALGFSEANRTDLNQQPDAGDAVAMQLAEQFPGLARFRFLSDDLVACRQAPRRKLELLLGSNRFPEPLPNPALTNHSSVAVTAGGKTTQQPALYQVVTYLTNSFSEKGD